MNKNKQSILFIVNPISGGKKKNLIIDFIKDYLSSDYILKFKYTEYKGHASEIIDKEKNNINIIGVIGGDGTINEVASCILESDSDICLWVIPQGSGNGLARSLKINLNYKKNIRRFSKMKVHTIDAGKMDNHYFFVTAGIGFDAVVAKKFELSSKRGLKNYIRIVIQSFFKCKNLTYTLTNQMNNTSRVEGIQLSVCNVGQYGNNFYISPKSSASDGELECVSIKKYKFLLSNLWMVLKIMMRLAHKTSNINIQSFKSLKVESNCEYAHVDGESIENTNPIIHFEVQEKALKVLI